MSIPVGGPGNVDRGGGKSYCRVCGGEVVYPKSDARPHHLMRVRMEPPRLQPDGRSIRGSRTASVVSVVAAGQGICTPSLGPVPRMAELTDDAHDHGADDER